MPSCVDVWGLSGEVHVAPFAFSMPAASQIVDVDAAVPLTIGPDATLPAPTREVLATTSTLDVRFLNDAGVVRDHFRIRKRIVGQETGPCDAGATLPQSQAVDASNALKIGAGAPTATSTDSGRTQHLGAAGASPVTGGKEAVDGEPEVEAGDGFGATVGPPLLLRPPSHGEAPTLLQRQHQGALASPEYVVARVGSWWGWFSNVPHHWTPDPMSLTPAAPWT